MVFRAAARVSRGSDAAVRRYVGQREFVSPGKDAETHCFFLFFEGERRHTARKVGSE